MKNQLKCAAIVLIAAIMFTACGGSSGGSDNPTDDPVIPPTGDGATFTEVTIHTTTIYILPGGTVAKAISTPNILGTKPTATFPAGTGDLAADYKPVPAQFIMAETLTTYELWSEVKTWATGHGYTFAHAGTNGYGNTTGSTQQPVTTINWRDAMVWCNALTEYYNANNGSGADLGYVYCTSDHSTPIRSCDNSTTITTAEGTEDNPFINTTAKGFRLPTNVEYEFAARYIGTTLPTHSNYVLKDGVYYTNGASASGATADYNNAATALVAVYGVSTTAIVKSKAANTLGLYDMSGNVWEWNFDWYPGYIGSGRVLRGGSFSGYASDMQVGDVNDVDPYGAILDLGFRFVRTQ